MLLKKWLDFWKENYIGNDNRERFYWLSYGAMAYVVFVAIGKVLQDQDVHIQTKFFTSEIVINFYLFNLPENTVIIYASFQRRLIVENHEGF